MSKRRRNPSGGFLQWAMIGGAAYFVFKSGLLGKLGGGPDGGPFGNTGRSITGTGLFPGQGDNKIWMASGGLQIFKPGDLIHVESGTSEHFNDGVKHVLTVSPTEITTLERYSNWGPGPVTISAV